MLAGASPGGQLDNACPDRAFPASLPANEFALSGTWSIGSEALTAKRNADIELNFTAADVYLDIGGTGTVTATFEGKTTTYKISGPPDIYPLVHGTAQQRGLLRVHLSRGLAAYSFTFG